MNMHHITTDVLIMGGGSAGLWAAYRCSELAPEARICVVDKGPRDWGGLMTMAGGDFEAVLPPDNVDEWVRDFIYYFDGLCDQDLMEEILKRSADRLHDYERFGCEFFKKEDGSMKYVPQRGLDHVKLYPAQLKGRGGELMVKNIVRQLKQRSVERVGRILLTELLQQDGRVCGALGFDTINGGASSMPKASPSWSATLPCWAPIPTPTTPPWPWPWRSGPVAVPSPST